MQGFRYADLKENHCSTSPCLNNGTCQTGFGDKKYRCICLTGVTGENCETVTDKCNGNPCDPIGGECTRQIEGFTCKCKPCFIGNGSTCHGPGTAADLPGKTCKDIQINFNTSTTGNYFIDSDWSKATQAFQVYCDMETDGGGWTLVWSYNFFAPLAFTSKENKVILRPSNMAKWGSKSTTTPTSETNYGAMNDILLGDIGKEFLVKSNINNWISCIPQGGTLGPSWDHGPISCRIVKVIPGAKCSNVVPDNTNGDDCGFMLKRGSNKCIYWEGCSLHYWPIHDPCCNEQFNQDLLDAVSEPRGGIFLR
ncbi:LOW QUALITY PROTEIN: neurogenic locus notch homolog protein 1 [Nematostella vectensis]|uniref:LOW QUALITY PROTEIN: neurogenic locus notch homolog protein 1 n=1 Tax=Nematostella vectensis TaxID=45351 RepID=UPI0020778B7A|nr:LOW QUALITY PROTEIN: neurogenic locus notch homolog protein 1 [Nematostella vectensis]